MLQLCNYGAGRTPGGGMALNEYRAHYAAWAILASPLILGNDLRNITQAHPACLALLLNPDIVVSLCPSQRPRAHAHAHAHAHPGRRGDSTKLSQKGPPEQLRSDWLTLVQFDLVHTQAVNQDPAALPPRLVWQHPPAAPNLTSSGVRAQAIARPLSGGRLALLLLNRGPAPATLRATWAQLGIKGTMEVHDVVRQRGAGTASGSFAAVVPSHDVSFVVLTPGPPA